MNNNDLSKIFVLDTNVLLHDAQSIYQFEENTVIIPMVVLEELDNFKKNIDETGRNSRKLSRNMDELRKLGDISKGVQLPNGGILKVDTRMTVEKIKLNPQKPDTLILETAYQETLNNPNKKVVLITKDINLRVKANILGIISEDYAQDKVKFEDLYSGIMTLDVGSDLISKLYKETKIDIDGLGVELYPNQYIVLKGAGSSSAIGRYDADQKSIVIMSDMKKGIWGITPRNLEQRIAMDLLLNDKIKLVTLVGKAGCGKTLLTLAAGLQRSLDAQAYKRVVVTRPIIPMGKDLGYLPGDIQEKMNPWIKPIMDNIDFLIQGDKKGQELIEQGMLEIEPLTYIRGRSMPGLFVIVDECFPKKQYIRTSNGKMTFGNINMLWKQKKEVPLIKSFNEKTNSFEFKKILNVWEKGERDLIEIKSALRKIKCTPNHKFLTIDKEWVEAQNLKKGTILLTGDEDDGKTLLVLNSDQEQIVIGSFLGDGEVGRNGLNRYRLKEQHGMEQQGYCLWKASMFNTSWNYVPFNGFSQKPAISFITKMFSSSLDFTPRKGSCSQEIIDKLDARGLAIWIADDGGINKEKNEARIFTCSFDEDTQKRLVKKLQDMGIDCRYELRHYKKRNKYFYEIVLNKEGVTKLIELIRPYTSTDIFYKISNSGYIDTSKNYVWDNTFAPYKSLIVDDVKILDKKEKVYDIEIEDNHNFIACGGTRGKNKCYSGPIVHNCQNLTPHEVKTIITRAGEGTKIILTGDCYQIDNPYVDSSSNGLAYAVEKFKNEKIAGHVTLVKGERSELAEIASNIL